MWRKPITPPPARYTCTSTAKRKGWNQAGIARSARYSAPQSDGVRYLAISFPIAPGPVNPPPRNRPYLSPPRASAKLLLKTRENQATNRVLLNRLASTGGTGGQIRRNVEPKVVAPGQPGLVNDRAPELI